MLSCPSRSSATFTACRLGLLHKSTNFTCLESVSRPCTRQRRQGTLSLEATVADQAASPQERTAVPHVVQQTRKPYGRKFKLVAEESRARLNSSRRCWRRTDQELLQSPTKKKWHTERNDVPIRHTIPDVGNMNIQATQLPVSHDACMKALARVANSNPLRVCGLCAYYVAR